MRTQVAFGVEVSEFQRAEPDPRNAIGYLASQELLATQWRLIPLREQQLGEVRTILPGDPGNERLLHAPISKSHFHNQMKKSFHEMGQNCGTTLQGLN